MGQGTRQVEDDTTCWVEHGEASGAVTATAIRSAVTATLSTLPLALAGLVSMGAVIIPRTNSAHSRTRAAAPATVQVLPSPSPRCMSTRTRYLVIKPRMVSPARPITRPTMGSGTWMTSVAWSSSVSSGAAW